MSFWLLGKRRFIVSDRHLSIKWAWGASVDDGQPDYKVSTRIPQVNAFVSFENAAHAEIVSVSIERTKKKLHNWDGTDTCDSLLQIKNT